MKEKLVLWLVATMIRWAGGPGVVHDQDRFKSIAESAVAISHDSDESPIYAGELGRTKAAIMLLSIASFESGGFNVKVDDGRIVGDHGGSHCLMQINLPEHVRIVVDSQDGYSYSTDGTGWSGKDLVQDRKKCFRAGYRKVRESIRKCGNLSIYTSGHCFQEERTSTHRMNRASWIFAHDRTKIDWTDDGILQELALLSAVAVGLPLEAMFQK